MESLVLKKTVAVFAVSIALGFASVSHAKSIIQDFEGGNVSPATIFFNNDGTGGGDSLAAEGLPDVTAFAGAGGGSAGDAVASLGLSANGGVGGSQAAVLTLTNSTETAFAFAGVTQSIGFAIGNPTDYQASVDVLAPAGVPLSLRVESTFGPTTNNGFSLNFVGTGAYETIGGILGTDLVANAAGAFDVTDTNTIIIVGSPIGIDVPVGVDQEIFIDNFSFKAIAIPEPSALVILLSLGSIVAVRRRRS